MAENKIKENKMGTAPMLPLILKMSLPAMFSMLIQSLYNVVDSIFVSAYDTKALTAVNFAFPLQMLMISVAVGTGIGINSLVSRRLGEGKHDEASHAVTHGVILAAASWAVFALIGIFLTKPFTSMFTNDAGVFNMTVNYLRIVTIFSFGCFVEINIEKSLQATGNMIFPMLFQLTGAVINIILDPILIFTCGLGIVGAAVATVTGQILSMIFSLIVLFAVNHEIHISFKSFKIRAKTIKDIYAVGVPSIIMQSIGAVMTSCLNGILAASEAAVNILGIYFKLQSFVFMPVFGLTHGVMPIMGYNFGARNKKRFMSSFRIGSAIAIIIMAVGTLIFWLFTGQLIGIYNYNAEMMRIGVPALRIISSCFIPAALGIMFSSSFQATGSGVKSLLISLLRQLIILLPAAFIFSKINLDLVWYAFPIAESVSLIASIVLFLLMYKKQIKNLAPFNFE